jgi:hypothetical protein
VWWRCVWLTWRVRWCRVTIVAVNAINGFVRLCAISRDCALDVTEKGGGVLPREVCRKR